MLLGTSHLGFYMLIVLFILLYAGALNFRDVMLAFGKLSRDLMAHGNGGDYIGLEFSGHVSRRNWNLQFLNHLSYCTALHDTSASAAGSPGPWHVSGRRRVGCYRVMK